MLLHVIALLLGVASQIPASEQCGGNLTGPDGTFTSPNYQTNYGNDENCTWLITVLPGHTIRLMIYISLLESDGVLVTVYEDHELTNPIGSYSGGSQFIEHKSRGNTMAVTFKSDQSGTNSGFYAEYFAECGGNLTSPNGTFTSPNYPNNHGNDENCTWLITVLPGHTIRLKINISRLQSDYDFVTVYEDHELTNPIGSYSGGPQFIEHESRENTMAVTFKSDNSGTNSGFYAQYFKECGGNLTGPNGTFTSPDYPNNHGNDENCIWLITVLPGHTIRLMIITLRLESGYDFVSVYGDHELTNPIGRYTGDNQSIEVESTGNAMAVQFTSDRSNVNTGFYAQYFELKVPVTSVYLTIPSEDTVNVTVNHNISFTCITNDGVPKATLVWYKRPETSSDVAENYILPTSYSDTVYNDVTMVTTSTLTLKANKYDHGMIIYCQARNQNTSAWAISNRMVTLVVWYAPGPLAIHGFANNSIYYLMRNKTQTLTCSITGGRPRPQLSWSCYSGQVESPVIEGDTVTSSITWAWSEPERTCVCISKQVLAGSTEIVLFTKALYPPEIPKFTVGSKQVSVIYLTEGESLNVTCNSSSSPAPSRYTWLLPNGLTTHGQQLNVDNVQYHANPVYTCIVENRMIPSHGAEVAGSSTAHFSVILSYSPRHVIKYQTTEDVEAVPGSKTVLGVTLTAFPLPTLYIWTRCKADICSVLRNDTNIFTSTFGLTSNLTIMNTQQEDFGQYKLTVSNGIGQPYNYTLFLRETVSARNQDTSTSLIGGVVGGVVTFAVIAAAVVIVLCLLRRKARGAKETTLYQNSKQQAEDKDVPEQTPAVQIDPHRNTEAGISATYASQSEYTDLSHYANIDGTYEEADDEYLRPSNMGGEERAKCGRLAEPRFAENQGSNDATHSL